MTTLLLFRELLSRCRTPPNRFDAADDDAPADRAQERKGPCDEERKCKLARAVRHVSSDQRRQDAGAIAHAILERDPLAAGARTRKRLADAIDRRRVEAEEDTHEKEAGERRPPARCRADEHAKRHADVSGDRKRLAHERVARARAD